VGQGIAWLKDAGAEIVEISLPHTKYALPCLLHHRARRSLVQPRPL
jgi:Asp-tRNA(Asn)/Glu-tRNA(Gln) amidotransferase A subunit family amidase